MGFRPHTACSFLSTPKETNQRKAPRISALRVPCAPRHKPGLIELAIHGQQSTRGIHAAPLAGLFGLWLRCSAEIQWDFEKQTLKPFT